jgi:hypothetical protein
MGRADPAPRKERVVLHAGLDLSRWRLDVCVLSDEGELVEELAAPTDVEGLKYLVLKVGHHGEPVRGVIESMTGARLGHDTLEQLGWDVLRWRPFGAVNSPRGRFPGESMWSGSCRVEGVTSLLAGLDLGGAIVGVAQISGCRPGCG